MDYQAYAYLQTAQDQKAKRRARPRRPASSRELDVTAARRRRAAVAGFYARAAIPARYALERGAWAEAAALPASRTPFPYADAITHFARALGAARSPAVRPTAARRHRAARGASRHADDGARIAYWTEQVDIQRQVATAWVAFAEGRQARGLALMRAAADAEDATDKSAITPGPDRAGARAAGRDAARGRQRRRTRWSSSRRRCRRSRTASAACIGAARAAEAPAIARRATRFYRQVLAIAKEADSAAPSFSARDRSSSRLTGSRA